MQQDCLGVDLGNVIIDHLSFGTTREFFHTGDYNTIPPVEGVFDALRHLNTKRFGGNVFVLYHARGVADQKILAWLAKQNFFDRTGIPPERVRRTENGRNKFTECEEYGATHFVDDRLEVLSKLVNKVEHLYLFRPQPKEVSQYREFLADVRQVSSWEKLLEIISTPKQLSS